MQCSMNRFRCQKPWKSNCVCPPPFLAHLDLKVMSTVLFTYCPSYVRPDVLLSVCLFHIFEQWAVSNKLDKAYPQVCSNKLKGCVLEDLCLLFNVRLENIEWREFTLFKWRPLYPSLNTRHLNGGGGLTPFHFFCKDRHWKSKRTLCIIVSYFKTPFSLN